MATTSWTLIDGYNLLHASGVLGKGGRTALEGAREALLDWLGEVLTEAQRRRATIVFDARDAPPGLPRTAERHGMAIRFAQRGGEADDLLEELIREHSAPRSLVVVSSDHRIHRAARRRKARPVDSEQWVAQVNRRRKAPRPPAADRGDQLDSDELKAWLDEFGAGS